MDAGLAALAFWGFLAVIVVAGIWYAMRERELQHETLRRMIESGQPVDQSLMDELLGGSKRSLGRDLRLSGIIVLFVAPGVALAGWLISLEADEWLFPMLGAAALVGCVGVGLLVASRFAERVTPAANSGQRSR